MLAQCHEPVVPPQFAEGITSPKCQTMECLHSNWMTYGRSLPKEIPPKLSISSFMGFLKGKTSIMIYQKYGNMKHEANVMQVYLQSQTCCLAKCERAKRRQVQI